MLYKVTGACHSVWVCVGGVWVVGGWVGGSEVQCCVG